jgi:hypothetical protein
MNFEHLSPINSDGIFFERFRKRSFLEKIARWAKRLCYGFLIVSAATMIVQLIFPFGNDVPDLFMQLLFFLIFWGTIEVLTLPLEYIQDFYIFDFEKNWLALSQQRFFYRRVVVIAAFNQIKAIGVSSEPHILSNPVVDSNLNRYAIFVQTLRNQLVQVSDFELSLEEADAFCHRLYSSHFSGAAYIGGAPGMEIFVMTLSLSVIQKISREMFAADLKIRHQPVFQLIAGIPPKSPLIDSDQVSTASATIVIELPASAPVTIDLDGQQVVVASPSSITSPSEVSHNQSNKIPEATSSLQIPPETVVLAEIPEKEPSLAKASQPDTVIEEPGQQSKQIKKSIGKRAQPVAETTIEMPAIRVPSYETNEKIEPGSLLKTFQSEAEKCFKPLSHSIPDYEPKTRPGRVATRLDESHSMIFSGQDAQQASILPGYGIHPIIQIGEGIDKAIKQFGQPPNSFQTQNEKQLIYPGLSLIINKSDGKIAKILISTNSIFSDLRTPQGIGIGSSFEEVEAKMGPYSLDKKTPGLHFSNQGISFLPDPRDEKKVGLIQINHLTKD